ncbi:MAG: class I SAM-dependent methyltransferase [Burkholderiales bacterium]
MTPSKIIRPDFPASFISQHPQTAPIALEIAEELWSVARHANLESLARHSPALRGFDWSAYLRMSAIRVVLAYEALVRAGVPNGRILDFGAYFGNFSLFFARMGYQVEALDAYEAHHAAFEAVNDRQKVAGIRVLDFSDFDDDLSALASERYDAVLLMGVIEHIPHSPRRVFQNVNRLLNPQGVLVLDTPNISYEYNRARLSAGESIHCPIKFQYDTEIPFEGHHREYTTAEILWMLERLGHETLEVVHFNYSICALPELTGIDAERYRLMEEDPERRELILTSSRKKLSPLRTS